MNRFLFLLVLLAVAANSCGKRQPAPKQERPYAKQEIEVAPGNFITVERLDLEMESYPQNLRGLVTSFLDALASSYGTTDLRIPWQGTNAVWKSEYIPFCLREHAGVLFIIAFDRETDFKKIRFRFYRQKGAAFEEIAAKDFPKAIATQNMWFGARYSLGVHDNLIDQVELAREINPNNVYFKSTLTAFVWYQLETGTEYYAMPGAKDSAMPWSIPPAFLERYVQTHSPVKLTRVVRDPPDAHLCFLRVENCASCSVRRAFFDAKGAPIPFLIVPNVKGGDGRFAWVRFVKDFVIYWDENGNARATVLDLSPYAAKTNQIASVSFTYIGQDNWRVCAQSGRDNDAPIVPP